MTPCFIQCKGSRISLRSSLNDDIHLPCTDHHLYRHLISHPFHHFRLNQLPINIDTINSLLQPLNNRVDLHISPMPGSHCQHQPPNPIIPPPAKEINASPQTNTIPPSTALNILFCPRGFPHPPLAIRNVQSGVANSRIAREWIHIDPVSVP